MLGCCYATISPGWHAGLRYNAQLFRSAEKIIQVQHPWMSMRGAEIDSATRPRCQPDEDRCNCEQYRAAPENRIGGKSYAFRLHDSLQCHPSLVGGKSHTLRQRADQTSKILVRYLGLTLPHRRRERGGKGSGQRPDEVLQARR